MVKQTCGINHVKDIMTEKLRMWLKNNGNSII